MTLAADSRRRKAAPGREAGETRAEPKVIPRTADLLTWYDRHRRTLPWRAEPGRASDPYHVWLSEIMLQQTTVKAVAPYFARFLARWPDVRMLAEAPLDDVLRLWAGLGYYARARNLHACAQAVVARHGGHFPKSETELLALPGIGRYTAAAIASIAFGLQTMPVDGNIERVVARLFAVGEELPVAKPDIWRLAQHLAPEQRSGDVAQAMMDLGATICTPKKPACALCPWFEPCVARARGDAEMFPVKAAKREGRLRRGAAFVVVRADGFVLVRSRPPKGLLGGMTEVPTTEWVHGFDESSALDEQPRLGPATPQWRRLPGVVTHVFTHFPLELVVYTTKVETGAAAPNDARWVPLDELAGEALPNVMRKVLAHALDG